VIGINRTGMGLKRNGKGVEGRGIKSNGEGGRRTKKNRVEGERDNEELHGREMKED
jgi:hypothetical protein